MQNFHSEKESGLTSTLHGLSSFGDSWLGIPVRSHIGVEQITFSTMRTKWSVRTFTRALHIPVSQSTAGASSPSRCRMSHRKRSRNATPIRKRHARETHWSAHTSPIGRYTWHACSTARGSWHMSDARTLSAWGCKHERSSG